MVITLDQLLKAVPSFNSSRLDKQQIANTMNEVFIGTSVNTVNRRAAYIAQTAVESWYYSELSENLNYTADELVKTFPSHFDASSAQQYAHNPQKIASRVYANMLGNGDEASGDGWTYRGRGCIQITGKYNYQTCSSDTNVDFLTDPNYGSTISGAFISSTWFWNKHDLNAYADQDDIRTITIRINGGLGDYAERAMLYHNAKTILSSQIS